MIGSTADFAKRLRRWYHQHRRDLPWRLPVLNPTNRPLDPYHVLVSEAMLQQTQVATVIAYFNRFIEKFPTLAALADADSQEVLASLAGTWVLLACAESATGGEADLVLNFNGQVPASVEELLNLAGIGRYTAGAVASIAFEERSPILDGNVARVLCRIDAVRTDPRETKTREKLWARAEEILPRKAVGDFNSALMELGALICTPEIAAMSDLSGSHELRGQRAGVAGSDSTAEARQANPALPTMDLLHSRWKSLSGRAAPYEGQMGGDVAIRDHRSGAGTTFTGSDRIALFIAR